MSRRSRRARDAERDASARKEPAPARRAVPSGWRVGVQIGLLVAVFAAVTAIAELAGAANLGVALGVGQVAFALVAAYLLLRR